jgi:zinc transport system permease protein
VAFFRYEFLVRGLIAAAITGAVAPTVGIYLLQRRLALIGDGLGHVAFAGVALGALTGTSPTWVALVVAVLGAIAVEMVRAGGRTGGDTALAILFYGGIAAGLVLISKSSAASPATLNSYLFGSLTTTTSTEVWITLALASITALITVGLRHLLFAVGNDEEYANACGLPVRAANLVLAVLTAVTVVAAMRIVGLLLVSAMMVIPVAAAQLFARSFIATLAWASVIGLSVAVAGVFVAYAADTPSGGTIVLLAVAAFGASSLAVAIRPRARRAVNRGP